jgi:hypothetical protein
MGERFGRQVDLGFGSVHNVGHIVRHGARLLFWLVESYRFP